MKKLLLIFLLIPSIVWAAPPTRQVDYISGTTIQSNDVEANEDEIFGYLSTGVDTLRVNAVDRITEINSSLKSGSDQTLVTGTSSGNTEFAIWNSDGDIVGSGSSLQWTDSTTELTISGSTNTTSLKISGLDCTSNNQGGALTTDAQGNVSCSDDNASAVSIGDAIGSGTSGSVLFIDSSGDMAQDNANLFWDDSNNNLGIGTATPTQKLEIVGNAALTQVRARDSNGLGLFDDGGNGIFVKDTGLIGIGDLDPDARLEISEEGTTPFMISDGDSGDGNFFIVNTSGNVGIGTIVTGQKLDLSDGQFIFSDSDVNQPTTNWGKANVLGKLRHESETEGGFRVHGFSDSADTIGLSLRGFIGSDDPTDTVPAVLIEGAKNDGATDGAVLGNSETLLRVDNYTTNGLMTVLGSGNVGIGTTAPARKLEVYTPTESNIRISAGTNARLILDADVDNDTTNDALVRLLEGGSANWAIGSDGSNSNALTFSNDANLGTNDRISITTAGNVGIGSASPQGRLDLGGGAIYGDGSNLTGVSGLTDVAFNAYPSSAQTNFATATDVTVVFGSERFDLGSDFASNTFTAPQDGKYQLSLLLSLGELDTAGSGYTVKLITSNKTYSHTFHPNLFAADGTWWLTNSLLTDMDQNDTAYIVIRQGAGTQQTDINTDSYFTGFLAGQ